jgi:hypothetical protein
MDCHNHFLILVIRRTPVQELHDDIRVYNHTAFAKPTWFSFSSTDHVYSIAEHQIHVRCGLRSRSQPNEATPKRGTNDKALIAAASSCNVCSDACLRVLCFRIRILFLISPLTFLPDHTCPNTSTRETRRDYSSQQF